MENERIDQVIGQKFYKKKSSLGEKERETICAFEECGIDEWNGATFVLLFFSAGWCAPCE